MKPVERLETTTSRGPRVERAHRRRLPHRHLMAFTELRGRIPVQLQRHRQRRLCVRTQRAVARSRRCGLSNAAHPHRMVITARQQRGPRRRTQCRRVETVVRRPPAASRSAVGVTTRPTEGARGAETNIIQQNDQHVRCTLRRNQGLDRRVGGIRILGVIRGQTDDGRSGNGQHRAGMSVRTHGFLQRVVSKVPRPPRQCLTRTG